MAVSGNSLHEKAGPHVPSPGPMFPILDMTVPIDSRNPTPKPIMTRMLIMAMIAYKNVNASTVDWIEGEITCLFTRTGNTALGCRICLNSFLATLKRITMRIHLIPPVVLPAQAPIIITIRRQPQRMEGQSI